MIIRRKNDKRSRRKTIFFLLLASVFIFLVGPFVWRMEQLRHAKSVYNVQKVQEELGWLEKNAGLLNNLESIRDTKLWLELNVGSIDIEESMLASYHDEKHQFWLYLLYLQEGKILKAQNILDEMSESSLKSLGKGVISLAKGDAPQCRRLLTEIEKDWKTLSIQEQAIRHLTLAQAAMIMGDHQSTKTDLKAAQRTDPNNPACLSVAFDVAINEGQWTKALELSRLIDAQTWRPQNTLYETKKAILAIHEDDILDLSNTLAALKKLPQGDVYINYVNGIHALDQGHLEEGKSLIEQSLNNGLVGQFKVDAQTALNQVNNREKADQNLLDIVAENK